MPTCSPDRSSSIKFQFPCNEEVGSKWVAAVASGILNGLKYDDIRRKRFYVCARHFESKYISTAKQKATVLRHGFPTLNLIEDSAECSLHDNNLPMHENNPSVDTIPALNNPSFLNFEGAGPNVNFSLPNADFPVHDINPPADTVPNVHNIPTLQFENLTSSQVKTIPEIYTIPFEEFSSTRPKNPTPDHFIPAVEHEILLNPVPTILPALVVIPWEEQTFDPQPATHPELDLGEEREESSALHSDEESRSWSPPRKSRRVHGSSTGIISRYFFLSLVLTSYRIASTDKILHCRI